MTRYDDLIQRLRDAAQPERPAPPELAPYVEKVRLHAYRVTDGDVDALKAAGLLRGRDLRAHRLGGRRGRARAARCGAAGAVRLAVVDASPAPRPLGVLKTLHYRPELFGEPYSDALDLALRGPSDWSAGERELFAAFVSSLNQCVF